MIVGSIVIPFLTLLGYVYSFDLIEHSIGAEAGRHHGYALLMMMFYPILLPLYWLSMWFFDWTFKQILIIK